eukprot:757991-Hanusia_phi.AAC.20
MAEGFMQPDIEGAKPKEPKAKIADKEKKNSLQSYAQVLPGAHPPAIWIPNVPPNPHRSIMYITPAARQRWEHDLQNFCDSKGISLRKNPIILGKPVDLCVLFHEVMALGGFQKVQETRRWRDVALAVDVPVSHSMAESRLKDNYLKYLHHLETDINRWHLPPQDIVRHPVLSGWAYQLFGPPAVGQTGTTASQVIAMPAIYAGYAQSSYKQPDMPYPNFSSVLNQAPVQAPSQGSSQEEEQKLKPYPTDDETRMRWFASWKDLITSKSEEPFKIPSAGGRELDFYQLFHEVKCLGGFEAVERGRMWRQVAIAMKIPKSKSFGMIATRLRDNYLRHLHPHEDVLPFEGRLVSKDEYLGQETSETLSPYPSAASIFMEGLKTGGIDDYPPEPEQGGEVENSVVSEFEALYGTEEPAAMLRPSRPRTYDSFLRSEHPSSTQENYANILASSFANSLLESNPAGRGRLVGSHHMS